MERDIKKISIIYILTGVILLLIIYLGISVYKSLTAEKTPLNEPDSDTRLEVASSCTFDMTMNEFNNIESNTEICGALNQINLTDVIINNETLPATIYYNGSGENTGIYINDTEIASEVSTLVKHKLTVLDNMLFMTTITNDSADFEVYNSNMELIYSLNDTLNNSQIEDPTFTALANPNLSNILTINNIDGNSFNFTNGQITFNSTSKLVCTEGAYSGSTFNITYANGVFNAPTYISGVLCQ